MVLGLVAYWATVNFFTIITSSHFLGLLRITPEVGGVYTMQRVTRTAAELTIFGAVDIWRWSQGARQHPVFTIPAINRLLHFCGRRLLFRCGFLRRHTTKQNTHRR